MAYESPSFYATFPASTGLSQYQMVHLSTAGVLINPTTLGEIVGVLVSSGTTGSTGRAGSANSGSVQTVQLLGRTKVLAGSTALAPGNKFAASTVDGSAIAFSETNNAIGYILQDVNSTGGDSTGGIGQQIVSALVVHLGLNSTIA